MSSRSMVRDKFKVARRRKGDPPWCMCQAGKPQPAPAFSLFSTRRRCLHSTPLVFVGSLSTRCTPSTCSRHTAHDRPMALRDPLFLLVSAKRSLQGSLRLGHFDPFSFLSLHSHSFPSSFSSFLLLLLVLSSPLLSFPSLAFSPLPPSADSTIRNTAAPPTHNQLAAKQVALYLIHNVRTRTLCAIQAGNLSSPQIHRLHSKSFQDNHRFYDCASCPPLLCSSPRPTTRYPR